MARKPKTLLFTGRKLPFQPNAHHAHQTLTLSPLYSALYSISPSPPTKQATPKHTVKTAGILRVFSLILKKKRWSYSVSRCAFCLCRFTSPRPAPASSQCHTAFESQALSLSFSFPVPASFPILALSRPVSCPIPSSFGPLVRWARCSLRRAGGAGEGGWRMVGGRLSRMCGLRRAARRRGRGGRILEAGCRAWRSKVQLMGRPAHLEPGIASGK
jgi:hypothetical protein